MRARDNLQRIKVTKLQIRYIYERQEAFIKSGAFKAKLRTSWRDMSYDKKVEFLHKFANEDMNDHFGRAYNYATVTQQAYTAKQMTTYSEEYAKKNGMEWLATEARPGEVAKYKPKSSMNRVLGCVSDCEVDENR